MSPTRALATQPSALQPAQLPGRAAHWLGNRDTRRAMAERACLNLLSGLRGEQIPFCVNPEVYAQNI